MDAIPSHETEYLIVGGGPAGLGAACRLEETGQHDWCLLEAQDHFGGLSASFVDEKGFTWDWGGHVLFSHYDSFDRYMDMAIEPGGWLAHERESWIWIRDRFVPYPFQQNLHRLDAGDKWACVKGLLDVVNSVEPGAPKNFAEWMVTTMGNGITDLFLMPYNLKVWAYPPATMDYNWIGERVAVPQLEQVLKSICTDEDEVSWGPNRVFRFPGNGGTGAIWRSIGGRLPATRISLNTTVERVDSADHVVVDANGDSWKYRHLVSTMPLDVLIEMATGLAVGIEAAKDLKYSATNIVGVGLQGVPPEHLETKCWMYFPESNSPYYRVTVFSNYSPNNVASPGAQWSLMAEVSESPEKNVDHDSLLEDTLLALEQDSLLDDRDRICSTVVRRIPWSYPIPFLGRDNLVDPILRRFEEADIYSRGRFGAWKYEVANQDHCFAQGRECVDRLTNGGGSEHEPTLFTPSAVNSRRIH